MNGPRTDAEPRLTIDGRAVELIPAYTSLRVFPEAFIGWWTDAGSYLDGQEHTVSVQFTPGVPDGFRGLFIDGPTMSDAPVAR